MAILLNVGIPTPGDMTSAGNTKRRQDINGLVQSAVRHLDEHRDPATPFTCELPDGSSIEDRDELAQFFRFKKWNVTITGPFTITVGWPA